MQSKQELVEKSINFKKLLEKSKNILYQNKAPEISLTITPKNHIITKKPFNIVFGINKTPFGKVLLAKTDRGISDLLFITGAEEDFIQKLFDKWQKANFTRDDSETESIIKKLFYSKCDYSSLNLHLTGTDFQIKVWQALLNIPEGYVVSYSDIAEFIKNSNANRAVGTAIGQNPVHFLIPCHRVIKKDGNIGDYAGGIAKKQAMLMQETLKIIA